MYNNYQFYKLSIFSIFNHSLYYFLFNLLINNSHPHKFSSHSQNTSLISHHLYQSSAQIIKFLPILECFLLHISISVSIIFHWICLSCPQISYWNSLSNFYVMFISFMTLLHGNQINFMSLSYLLIFLPTLSHHSFGILLMGLVCKILLILSRLPYFMVAYQSKFIFCQF